MTTYNVYHHAHSFFLNPYAKSIFELFSTTYRHFVATEAEDETVGEIANVWEVLGRRWSLLILKNFCTNEVIRFNEFKKLLPGISSTVLADRLLELEREGLVSKKIYPEIPPKVEYRLTLRAKELREYSKN
jgi:DNA-binding HxlR family transcriptional regulator